MYLCFLVVFFASSEGERKRARFNQSTTKYASYHPSVLVNHSSLHVETCNSRDIPLDHLLACLHLCKQLRVPNNPRCVLNLATRLVQSRDDPDNSALQHIRQISDVLEAHTSSPLVDDFHQAEAGARDEIVGVVGGEDDLVIGLSLVDLLGDLDDGLHAPFEVAGEVGYDVCLFLEDEGGEEGDDLGGFVGGEHVVENEFGKDELIS